MPLRIYALAKELNVDSKQLVDLCAKAGVTGKGSALASLTEEEADKVRAYLAGGSRPAAKPKLTPPTLPPRVSAGNAPSTTTTAAAAVAPPPPTAAPTPVAPVTAGVLKRDDAYSGRTASREIKVLAGNKSPRKDDESRPPQEDRKRPEPPQTTIKLAPVPAANQPAPQAKTKEPVAQKPTIRLPKDAIAKVRQGSSSPLDQIREEAERKRKKDDQKKPRDGAVTPTKAKHDTKPRKPMIGAPDDEEGKKNLAGMAGNRKSRTDLRKVRPGVGGDEDTPTRIRPRKSQRQPRSGPSKDTAAPRKEKVTVTLPCTIRQFSEAAGISAVKIIKRLFEMGIHHSINSSLDMEMAEHLALDLDLQNVELKEASNIEEELLSGIRDQEDAPESLEPRPPVVTVLGHVDHGKTSLLDRIIGIDVVSGEAGGITQHIRAYSVKKDGRTVSFVDTPGHEAFTEMRARGANVTDIAVIVIAADDGIMPQTEEAISHAQAAEVPIVVALNKMDLPAANPDRVMQQLTQHNLLPVAWGGDVEVVQTSALKGQGIDTLLETLLLTADIHEYKANPHRDAYGVCLEAQQESGRGVVAKLMVQNGTLKVGDIVVCGAAHGRVKAMYHTLKNDKKLKEAGPSMPVNVTGFDIAPEAGESFYVLQDIAQAREVASRASAQKRQQTLAGDKTHVTFLEFQQLLSEGRLGGEGKPAELKLILRADVRGSIEAIQKELAKLDHPEVKVRILQASVGGITVGDVTLAHASDAVIVGFNVIPDEAARALADEKGVEIRRYDIIYRVTADIKDMLEGKLTPEKQVKELGRALVKQIFTISRIGTIAGCHVLDGVIQRGCRIRVNREGRGIGEYPLDSLRREKDDAKEVRKGFECGIKLAGFNDLKEGDILEAYLIEEVRRELITTPAAAAT